MNIKEMTIDELVERRSAIATEVENDGADLDALENEVREINAELETRKAQAQKKAEIRSAVANGVGVVVEKKEEGRTMDIKEIRASKAYLDAYAEYLKTEDPTEVRALLTSNVEDGTVPVPTYVEDKIRTAWEKDDIVSRITKTFVKGNLGVGFEKSATDATEHEEGATAPDEEELEIGLVTLVPKTIKKWITLSDEVMDMKGADFIDYIYAEIAHKITIFLAHKVVNKVKALPSTATATSVSATKVNEAPALKTVADAIAVTSDEATNLVVIMNKSTWAYFKGVQYAGNYAVDPFEGLPVLFSSALPAYSTASDNATYMIVGDLSAVQANFPNGAEIKFKFDDLSLAEQDLVKIVGRQYGGVEVVADKRFAIVTKPATI